jgi:hypothetical protein
VFPGKECIPNEKVLPAIAKKRKNMKFNWFVESLSLWMEAYDLSISIRKVFS